MFIALLYFIKKRIKAGDRSRKPDIENEYLKYNESADDIKSFEIDAKEAEKIQKKFEQIADRKNAGMLSMETADSEQGKLSINKPGKDN